MTPEQSRSRIQSHFARLSADLREKEEVRELIGSIWQGGLYGGDAIIQPDKIEKALNALKNLTVISKLMKDRKAILCEMLESLSSCCAS